MTAPYNPFFDVDSPLVRRPAPPAPEAHDRIFDQLRTSGPGPTPADASAVRPPTPRASAREVGAQFAHGLGESGLQAVEMLGRAADVMNPAAAAGLQPGAYSTIHKLLANTRRQMSEYYGEPKTEEEVAFNLLGNLTGSAAIGAVGEGVARPVQSILSELRASAAPFRLVKSGSSFPRALIPGFEPTDLGYSTGGFSEYNYDIVNNMTGKRVGGLHGNVQDQGRTFYVDMISASEGGPFSSGSNKLGLRATRNLLRQLQDLHPNVEMLAGERVGGVRASSRMSLLDKGASLEQFPKALEEETNVRVPRLNEPFPTFRKLPETVRNDLSRIMREERGSFKWGVPGVPEPTPEPDPVYYSPDFQEIMNRAYFGRPTGPLPIQQYMVEPGLPIEPGEVGGLERNRLLASDDMRAMREAPPAARLYHKNMNEIENRELRRSIMRNFGRPEPLEPVELRKGVTILDFLKGLSRQ